MNHESKTDVTDVMHGKDRQSAGRKLPSIDADRKSFGEEAGNAKIAKIAKMRTTRCRNNINRRTWNNATNLG